MEWLCHPESVAVEFVRVIWCHLGEVLENVLVRFISCKEKPAWLREVESDWSASDTLNTHTSTCCNLKNTHTHRDELHTCSTSQQKLTEQQESAGEKSKRSVWEAHDEISSIFIDSSHDIYHIVAQKIIVCESVKISM